MFGALNPICSSWKNFIWEKGFFWFLCHLPKPSNDRVYVDLLPGFLFDQCPSSDLDVNRWFGVWSDHVTCSKTIHQQCIDLSFCIINIYGGDVRDDKFWCMNSSKEKVLNCKQGILHDNVLHQIWMSLMIWSLGSPCHLLKAMYSSTIFWIFFLHCQHLWRWCERWQFSMCEYVKWEGTDL